MKPPYSRATILLLSLSSDQILAAQYNNEKRPLAGRPDCEGEQHRPQQRHPGGFQFSIIFQLYQIFGQFDVTVNRSLGRSCDGVKDCDRGSHVGGEEAEAAVGGEVGRQGGEVGVQGGEEGQGGEVRGLEEVISSRLAE